MGGCRSFIHRFSRIFLFITNICVALLGAGALAVGIWGLTQRDYTEIADGSDTNFDAYPIVLVVVGVFLLILGTMGFVGAVCGNKVLGRILLFLYGVLMGVIVLLAIAGAIAGYIRRDDLEDDFRENAWRTLNLTRNRTDYRDDWNVVQRDLHCCGATNYSDWLNIDWYTGNRSNNGRVVPVSCCARVGGCEDDEIIFEDDIPDPDAVWTQNCVDAISDRISDQIGVIAGVSITIAVLLVLATLMSFYVACVKHEASSYEVV